ncbi:MAG: RodZ domain-containing protein [Micropepsaceae bacterium]
MAKVTRLSFDQGDELERRRLHLREISPDIDAPLETVGQDLRTARQRKGEDLATVSRCLKIRKDHLNALEEGKFDLLPGRTYAVGFVRSYARYLGLETNVLVERYKAEVAGLGEANENETCLAPEVERKLPQGTIVFVALLLIGIAYGGYYIQSSANQMLTEREAAIPARLETVVTEQSQGNADPQPAQAVSQPQSAALVSQSLPDGAGGSELGQAELETAAQNLPSGQSYGTRNTDSRITLRIHETSNVRIIGADGTLFINRTLNPGDTYRAPNIVGMTISSANSGVVELILDGSPLGFLGANGAAADALSLNPQDIVDRAQ